MSYLQKIQDLEELRQIFDDAAPHDDTAAIHDFMDGYRGDIQLFITDFFEFLDPSYFHRFGINYWAGSLDAIIEYSDDPEKLSSIAANKSEQYKGVWYM
jgi:hypothetical protein